MSHKLSRMFDRELKKGSAELLILCADRGHPATRLRPRTADRGAVRRRDSVQGGLALSVALSPRGARLDSGPLGREAGAAPPPVLPAHGRRAESAGGAAKHVGRVCRRDRAGDRGQRMPDGWRHEPKSGRALRLCTCPPIRKARDHTRSSAQDAEDRHAALMAQGIAAGRRRRAHPQGSRRDRLVPSDCERCRDPPHLVAGARLVPRLVDVGRVAGPALRRAHAAQEPAVCRAGDSDARRSASAPAPRCSACSTPF